MTIAAFRYNNPFDVSLPIAGYNGAGNVVGVQGQKGYASFPDMSTGYAAGVQRLNSYISGQSSHGPKGSINELNTVYATDPNWAAGVARHSGIGADEKLDPSNAAQMSKLQYGVLAQEIGPENAARVMQGNGGSVPSSPSLAPMSMAGPQAAPQSTAPSPAPSDTPPLQPTPAAPVASSSPVASYDQIAALAAVPKLANILPARPNPFGFAPLTYRG
jgi:hypothetical protein